MTSKNTALRFTACLILALTLIATTTYIGPAGPATAQAEKGTFETVTPKEAQQLMLSKKNLMIVDVRGQQELKEGWIEGSVLMPMPEILKGTRRPPQDRPILLVCAVGGRSLGLGQLMFRYGWPEIYNLEGGISNWKKLGLPLKYK